jgi:hypothetical protein
MNKQIICRALQDHFGHRSWTLIGTDKVQLDGSDEVVEVSSLGLDALLAAHGNNINKGKRIAELKALLTNSDYKVLPDYDKDSEAIKAQRQAWREEIRTLEAQA